MLVCFKNLKSMEEKIKKTIKLIKTQRICRLKKSPVFSSGVKDFIVKSPAAIIGRIKRIKSQSIPLEIFFAEFCAYFITILNI